MSKRQADGSDPSQLVADAMALLNEALALLDTAQADYPAALTDLAINTLKGWIADPITIDRMSDILH